jgi:methylglyoxal synthase
MLKQKRIALVAHDARKADLLEWVGFNAQKLANHKLLATGTTGSKIKAATDLPIHSLKSGPLGGDQQLGARIADGKLDMLIFFWDPMTAQPHDVDVKALLRMAILYNVVVACNRSTADYIISSKLFDENYTSKVKDYAALLPPEDQE